VLSVVVLVVLVLVFLLLLLIFFLVHVLRPFDILNRIVCTVASVFTESPLHGMNLASGLVQMVEI
jgi:hypothetical protein